MPTYDYVCDACGHEFEAFESIKADPQTDCAACGKPSLRRRIGPGAAILFKGSGFYQTDYRSDSYKSAAQADQSKPATEKAGTDAPKTTTDTTPTPAAKSPGESKSTGKKAKS